MSLSKALITKIHVAKSQTPGLDDDSYRAMLLRISNGKTNSSKGLTQAQAEKVLEEFKAKGWKPKPSAKAKGKPKNFDQMPARITKIEALLADMRLPWAYADALAKQMFKVDRVSWLKLPKQLDALIAALHVEQEKRQLLASVEELCKELGIDAPERVAGLEQLPEGWQRQRPILQLLIDALNAAVVQRREE
ncbi:regulatory protein GemA [Pseudomonas sp. HMWF032]|uniref:gp16 family protein n=1 Tax=Pseudomonas sp. HMWF032 TaxID=2056866 RepID=UPI000D3920BC|nr:regulatory protein GemA [Pseudomonas sp. HMWF032]PTS85520.1 regulatory protein GemA [Pseudomonas sp. HMWF032]PTT82275.1 regulatory protein GemA [Pseudomonas sp. HMWF010]